MAPNLGSNLRRLRQSRHLSQAQAARVAGIGRVTLNRWESGGQQPRALDLEAFLTAMEVSQEERRQAMAILNTPQARVQIRDSIERNAELRGLGPMPHGGDLLKALRVRRELSQEETARRVGVTMRTLRRWENFESWPSPTQVQDLCYVLKAHPEEMMALTVGDLSSPAETEPVTLDELKERSIRLHFYSRDSQTHALKELLYLTMAAQAWPLVARTGSGWPILAAIYGFHAYHLAYEERFAEATSYANRALDLVPSRGTLGGSQVLAAIVAARSAVYRGPRPAPRRGLEILRHWLDVAEDPEYEAWAISDMATYLTQMGQVDAGLRLAKKAKAIGARCANRHELYSREVDEAELLVKVGKSAEALRLIQRERVNPCTEQAAKFALLEAEAYLNMDQPAPAQDRVENAFHFIARRNLTRLQPRAQKLAARF